MSNAVLVVSAGNTCLVPVGVPTNVLARDVDAVARGDDVSTMEPSTAPNAASMGFCMEAARPGRGKMSRNVCALRRVMPRPECGTDESVSDRMSCGRLPSNLLDMACCSTFRAAAALASASKSTRARIMRMSRTVYLSLVVGSTSVRNLMAC